MNVPDTYSELQEAVKYMESHDLGEDAQCMALREILDAADALARATHEFYVDAALRACRECIGSHASKEDYLSLLINEWNSYEEVEEYAQCMADGMGMEIPDFIKYHIDWESLGRELLRDVSTYTFFEHRLYIFQD